MLYDNIWWVASKLSRFEICDRIKPWLDYGNLTAIVCLVTYAACRMILNKDPVFSDHIMFLPVLAFNPYDIKQLMKSYEQRQPRGTAAATTVR